MGTMSATMIANTIADTAQMKRLTELAADVAQLADERIDLQLRERIDRLHADLPQKRCAGTATSSGPQDRHRSAGRMALSLGRGASLRGA
jgi:hypothetical protein